MSVPNYCAPPPPTFIYPATNVRTSASMLAIVSFEPTQTHASCYCCIIGKTLCNVWYSVLWNHWQEAGQDRKCHLCHNTKSFSSFFEIHFDSLYTFLLNKQDKITGEQTMNCRNFFHSIQGMNLFHFWGKGLAEHVHLFQAHFIIYKWQGYFQILNRFALSQRKCQERLVFK